jgi:hypothetical protein
MMRSIRDWRVVAGGAAAVATLAARLALGGPLDQGVVDKDAKWLVHVDVEAGLSSTCGRYLLEEIRKSPEKVIEQATALTGLDPTKDVKGLTIYGFKPGEDNDGVVVAITSTAADQLPEKLKGAKLEGFEAIVKNGVKCYSWTSDEHTWYLAVRRGAGGEDRVVVVASDEDALDHGLAVLGGDRASLKAVRDGAANEPMLTSPSKGSIVFVAVKGLGDCPKFKANLVKDARTLVIDAGEDAGEKGKESYARASMSVGDEQRAASLQQMVQGMVAFASMMARDNGAPEAADSLARIKVGTEGANVTASIRESSEGVVKRLKQLQTAVEQEKHGKRSVSVKYEDKGDEGAKGAKKEKTEKEPKQEK